MSRVVNWTGKRDKTSNPHAYCVDLAASQVGREAPQKSLFDGVARSLIPSHERLGNRVTDHHLAPRIPMDCLPQPCRKSARLKFTVVTFNPRNGISSLNNRVEKAASGKKFS